MQKELKLGITDMDQTHREFLELLNAAKSSSGTAFLKAFEQLIGHTEAHFKTEETLMRERSFHGLAEHREEHENLLGEIRYFYEKTQKMPAFGRAYIDEYAYDKFYRHIINIDSQLAQFLKGVEDED